MFKPTCRVHSYDVRGASYNGFVPRPVLKLLSGHLAIGGDSHVEWPRKCA